jgi:hypothetical protein
MLIKGKTLSKIVLSISHGADTYNIGLLGMKMKIMNLWNTRVVKSELDSLDVLCTAYELSSCINYI